uniref:BSD domain-containing protein n=1 Tax=Bursaphelenchus xylophilus TaxID=6326 RepID=A0A1I7RXX5_BURXY
MHEEAALIDFFTCFRRHAFEKNALRTLCTLHSFRKKNYSSSFFRSMAEKEQKSPEAEGIQEKTPVPEETPQEPVEEAAQEEKKEDLTSPTQWFSSYSSYLGTVGADWVGKAKEQVEKTLDAVKKDLNEFSDTVNTEAAIIKESVKKQAELFQEFVTTPDADTPENPEEEPAPVEPKEEPKLEKKESGFGFGWMKSVVDTVKNMAIEDTAKDEYDFTDTVPTNVRNSVLEHIKLLELQNSEATFLKPPTQNIEVYKDWLKEFKLSEYNGEINVLLGNNPKLREIYAKFVPSRVDNHTFWNRYFFKVYIAEMEQELRQNKGKIFEELQVDTSAESSGLKDLKSSGEKKDVSPSVTENESWSVCSSGADDLAEFPDEPSDEQATVTTSSTVFSDAVTGPLTPKATDEEESTPDSEWEKWEAEKSK